MTSFNELSESQPIGGGARGPSARPETGSMSASGNTPKARVFTDIELNDLRVRATEARMRTQELAVKYLAACARTNIARAQSRDAAGAREESRAALSASVARYATLLRALGEPPERTLVHIKTAFSEAAPQQDDDNRAALEEVVKWIVDAYYAA